MMKYDEYVEPASYFNEDMRKAVEEYDRKQQPESSKERTS